MRPAVATGLLLPSNTVLAGREKFGLLKTLNPSRRTCNRTPSAPLVRAVSLTNDRSTVDSPGPATVFRPSVPYTSGLAGEKELASKYLSGPPRTGLLVFPGIKS